MDYTDYWEYTLFWITVDSFIIVLTLAGNILTLCAIKLSRKLSGVISNKYIYCLAVSDLMVGLSIPFHMVFYISDSYGRNKVMCLLRFVFIIFACASSVINLLFIATDRYIAIMHPLHYNRYMTRKVANILVTLGRLIPLTVATIPLYWNHWYEGAECDIVEILPTNYLCFLVTPLFCTIWVAMFFLYIRIWREAAGHAKRLRTISNYQQNSGLNDSKSIQVVLIILGCFSICWLPYFGITMYKRLSYNENTTLAVLYEIAFTMAVGNSCVNPIVYAWKNTNFRKAFLCILKCQSPNSASQKVSYITNHVPSKKNSLNGGIGNGINDEDMTRSELNLELCHNEVKGDYKDTEERSIDTAMTSAST